MHVEVGMSIGYFRVQNSPFKTMLSAMSFICMRIVTAFSNSFINVSVYLVFTTSWGHNNNKKIHFHFSNFAPSLALKQRIEATPKCSTYLSKYALSCLIWANPKQWILESTPWITDVRYWILVVVSATWILDSNS